MHSQISAMSSIISLDGALVSDGIIIYTHGKRCPYALKAARRTTEEKPAGVIWRKGTSIMMGQE